MREFFHGWRRKAGCVLLVMACGLATSWVRSWTIEDSIDFMLGHRQQRITSDKERLLWGAWDFTESGTYGWSSKPHPELSGGGFVIFNSQRPSFWTISHWTVVLPLTLLSAYLILWKPRKQKSARTENGSEL